MTDLHDLISRMADELDHYRQLVTDDRREVHPLAVEARAALAQPGPEVVGVTMQLPEQAPDEHPPSSLDRREIAAWYHGHGCGWQAARAALARWGRPAPAPAGERQAAPVPVAVSDRLPQPEDCDAEGRCWWYRYTPTPEWHLRLGRTGQHNHWLPAYALPLPSMEVEHG